MWRRRRGADLAALAAIVGVAAPELARVESGEEVGDVRLYVRLAAALRLRIEDLVPDEDGTGGR